MTEQKLPPRIDERPYTRLALLTAGVMAFLLFSMTFVTLFGGASYGPGVLTAGKVLGGVGVLTCVVILVRCLICRVRMDEQGVDVDNVFAGSTCFGWGDLRTAAVVYLTINGQQSGPLIILSNREPKDVLTRRALIDGKGLTRHEHMRIPHSAARQQAVEYYLRMKLPEIRL